MFIRIPMVAQFAVIMIIAIMLLQMRTTDLMPFIYLIFHLTYALGLIFGLTTDLKNRKRKKRKNDIQVVKIKSFEKNWENFDTI